MYSDNSISNPENQKESIIDNTPKLKKLDLLLAAIIGEFVALVLIFIGKNVSIAIPFASWLPFIFPVLSVIGLYVSYLAGKWRAFIFQIGKFFLVGSLNTFLDLGILNLLIFLTGIAQGIGFSVFKGLAVLIAITNSFFWNKLWTFQAQKGSFLQFFIITIIGFFLNVGLASFMVNVVGPVGNINLILWANISALSAVVVTLIWNFLGYKFIVFKK